MTIPQLINLAVEAVPFIALSLVALAALSIIVAGVICLYEDIFKQ